MTDFHPICVRLTDVRKHPNADSLSVAKAGGYPVIVRSDEWSEGDLAAYVPVDALVPVTRDEFSFLVKDAKADNLARIKAKKLRGIFSMGLVVRPPSGAREGDNIAEHFGILKYDPDLARETQVSRGRYDKAPVRRDNERDPGLMPKYDIESLRKYESVFQLGEEVWISEKIHGQNARFLHDGKRLWVASRNFFKRKPQTAPSSLFEALKGYASCRLDITFKDCWTSKGRASVEVPSCTWWDIAERYELERKLATVPAIAIYGETYGNNADMRYGTTREEFVMFDAYDTVKFRWLDVDELFLLAGQLALPVVPTLYRGPWYPELGGLAEGKTTLGKTPHVREGIVVKPIKDRTHPKLGRVFLKLCGEGYYLRKEAS